jgi:hypothetical protein
MSKQHHIMIWRTDCLFFVGPFYSHDEAADWGAVHGYGPLGENAGDPRWQVVSFDPHAPLDVRNPDDARVPE